MIGAIWLAVELQCLCHATRSSLRYFQTNIEEMYEWRVVLDNEE